MRPVADEALTGPTVALRMVRAYLPAEVASGTKSFGEAVGPTELGEGMEDNDGEGMEDNDGDDEDEDDEDEDVDDEDEDDDEDDDDDDEGGDEDRVSNRLDTVAVDAVRSTVPGRDEPNELDNEASRISPSSSSSSTAVLASPIPAWMSVKADRWFMYGGPSEERKDGTRMPLCSEVAER